MLATFFLFVQQYLTSTTIATNQLLFLEEWLFSFLSRNVLGTSTFIHVYVFKIETYSTNSSTTQLALFFQCTLLIIMLSNMSSWVCIVMCLIKSFIDQRLGCFQFFTSKWLFYDHPLSIFEHLHEYVCREIFLIVQWQGQGKLTFLILMDI